MEKITLARAFVLRGFFRKTISELDREIKAEDLTSEIEDSKSFFKDESTEKENDTHQSLSESSGLSRTTKQ